MGFAGVSERVRQVLVVGLEGQADGDGLGWAGMG